MPYDLNPRVTRNPRYDELKLSIRHRGLDTPPPSRRPDERHYIIRNGGRHPLSAARDTQRALREILTTADRAFEHVTKGR